METKACAVCGLADTRALVTAKLVGGEKVTLCATHELIHRRLGADARTVAALRAIAGERRRAPERRESFPCDELGAMLTAGFTRERRAGRDRRG